MLSLGGREIAEQIEKVFIRWCLLLRFQVHKTFPLLIRTALN